MRRVKLLTMLLLLVVGASNSVFAQTAVTVGSKVADAGDIVSGNPYLIKYTSMTGTPYIYDAGTTTPLQAPSTQNTPNTACVFYFISDGNGAYKLENAYTGNYWPAPTGNQRLYPTTAANAGSWAISITSGTATLTCENSGTTYGLDRLTPDVAGWSSRKTVEIYEVSAADFATSATYATFTDKDINVSSTEAASISEGQWYVMSQRSRSSYVFENTSDHKLKHTLTIPSGSAAEKAGYLVRTEQVLSVEMKDQPGGLDAILKDLQAGNINIDYIYISYDRKTSTPMAIIRTQDISEVELCLQSYGHQMR